MPRSDQSCLQITAITFALIMAFDLRPSDLLGLCSLPFVFAFLVVICVSIVKPFTQGRTRGWRALIPLLACAVAIASVRPCARAVHAAAFAWALPSYERIIDDIQSGRIKVSDRWSELHEVEPSARLVDWVCAEIEPDGSLYVEFMRGYGIPAHHSGFAYTSSDTSSTDRLNISWRPAIPLRPHWYSLRD